MATTSPANGLPPIAGDGRRPKLALMIALGLMQAAGLGLAAYATRSIFDTLHRGIAPVPAMFVLLVAAAVMVAALRVWGKVVAEAIGEDFAGALRQSLYGHMAGMDRSSLNRRRRGTLALRFVADVQAARAWAGTGVAAGIAAAITLVATTAVFLHLRPALAVAALAPLLPTMGIAVLLGLRHGRRHGAMRANRSRMAASMVERISLAPDLDLIGRTPKELRRLGQSGREIARNAVARRRQLEWMRAMPMIGTGAGGALALWVTATGGLAASEAATALAILSILSLPLGDLVMTFDRYCAWRIARASCLRLLQTPSRQRRVERAGHPVSIRYDGPAGAAQPVTISIAAGSVAVLSGPAASGKSRLARILAGQDRPGDGRLAYGDSGTALPCIAYISDEPLILKGSLRRALTLGVHPRPEPRQIRKIAKSFGLTPLLARLGSTKAALSERGSDLSLAEQLAVGLTRAVLMQPDLIVIDHPALDRPEAARTLVARLRDMTEATLVLVGAGDRYGEADQIIDLGKAAACRV